MSPPLSMSPGANLAYCRMPVLACVAVTGTDADDFLRRQLTQNPPEADGLFARAAWNDAKGRVRALFEIARADNRLLLVAERDGLAAVLAKLRMFVLRSDVGLAADESLAVAAIVGDSAAWLESLGVPLGRDPGAARWARGVLWLRLAPGFVRIVGAPDTLDRIGAELGAGGPERADLEEIRLGLPRVAALPERYVPQMLNLDRLGAVSFTKGCYPGQEVVARLHHLGSVKRRVLRFAADADPPVPGTPLVDRAGAAVGDVLRAASDGGRTELLAVVQLDAADTALFLGENGPPLTRLPLPTDAAPSQGGGGSRSRDAH